MNETEFKVIIREKTDAQLHDKLVLGDIICALLSKDTDSRAGPAISRMRRQQTWIMDVQAERKKAERERAGEPEPPALVVGLQPLRLAGKATGVSSVS